MTTHMHMKKILKTVATVALLSLVGTTDAQAAIIEDATTPDHPGKLQSIEYTSLSMAVTEAEALGIDSEAAKAVLANPNASDYDYTQAEVTLRQAIMKQKITQKKIDDVRDEQVQALNQTIDRLDEQAKANQDIKDAIDKAKRAIQDNEKTARDLAKEVKELQKTIDLANARTQAKQELIESLKAYQLQNPQTPELRSAIGEAQAALADQTTSTKQYNLADQALRESYAKEINKQHTPIPQAKKKTLPKTGYVGGAGLAFLLFGTGTLFMLPRKRH